MIPVMIALSGIDPDTKVNEISREQRQNLLHLFKKYAAYNYRASRF